MHIQEQNLQGQRSAGNENIKKQKHLELDIMISKRNTVLCFTHGVTVVT